MRRTSSPQESSGRRECGGGQGQKSTEKSDHVWAVVATLARALTDARDQLMALINCSTPTPTRSSSPYPGAGPWIPNVNHRYHAFARSPGWVRPLFHAEASPPPEGRRPSRRRSTHRLRDPTGPESTSPYPPSRAMQQYLPHKQRSASSRSCNRNVVIQQGSRYQQQPRLSPDPRRHCMWTEYAAPLRKESTRMRERRRVTDPSCRGPRLPRRNHN